MKESKSMMRREVAFMKKKGAPKSMIRHEEAEMGGKMKKGVKKMARGGTPMAPGSKAFLRNIPGSKDYYQVPNPLGYVGIGPKAVNIPKGYSDQKQRIEAQHKGIPYDPRVNWMPKPPSREEAIKYFPNPDYDPAYDPAYEEQFGKIEEMRQNREPMKKAHGGSIKSKGGFRRQADGVAHKGKTKGRVVKMAGGGMAYSSGGSVFRKGADGIASKGKTKGRMVKMAYGGKC